MNRPRLTIAAGHARLPDQRFWEAVAGRGVDIDVIALSKPDSRSEWIEVAEHMRLLEVPYRHAHWNLLKRWHKRPGATEARALGLLFRHTPEYGEALARSARLANAVVSAGALAASALLLHTRAPLLIDAGLVQGPTEAAAGRIDIDAAKAERRALAAATLVRAWSPRHAAQLAEHHDLSVERIITSPSAGSEVPFTDMPKRSERQRRTGLTDAPILLASGDDEASIDWGDDGPAPPDQTATGQALAQLEATLGMVRVARGVDAQRLSGLLAVANAGLVLDDGPAAAARAITYARAGVPLLAEAAVLADAGLSPGEHAVVVSPDEELADAVRSALAEDHGERVRAAREAVAERSQAAAAGAFLSDDRVASLLKWGAPMRRRPRSRKVMFLP